MSEKANFFILPLGSYSQYLAVTRDCRLAVMTMPARVFEGIDDGEVETAFVPIRGIDRKLVLQCDPGVDLLLLKRSDVPLEATHEDVARKWHNERRSNLVRQACNLLAVRIVNGTLSGSDEGFCFCGEAVACEVHTVNVSLSITSLGETADCRAFIKLLQFYDQCAARVRSSWNILSSVTSSVESATTCEAEAMARELRVHSGLYMPVEVPSSYGTIAAIMRLDKLLGGQWSCTLCVQDSRWTPLSGMQIRRRATVALKGFVHSEMVKVGVIVK